jgi:hypothetical protein
MPLSPYALVLVVPALYDKPDQPTATTTITRLYSTVCTPAPSKRWGMYHYLELIVPPLD